VHKFQKCAASVNHRGELKIPYPHRRAICKAAGIEDLKGCILEINITVIHLIDNRKIDLSK